MGERTLQNRTENAVERFYNRWVRLYDAVATAPGVGVWRERAVGTLSLSAGETVLDVGCGTGANFPYLRAQVGPAGTVVGIDLADRMVRRARTRARRSGWENVHVLRGDAGHLPVDKVDAVLSTFVVGMFPEPAPVIKEWIRSVSPDRRITILNAKPSDRPVMAPVNLLFRAFVRLTTPDKRLRLRSPATALSRRWRRACDGLFGGTVGHLEDQFGFGLVVLASGRVPAD